MTTENKRGIGRMGENHAAAYLQKLDYKIIYRNFHARYGEIDLVCLCGRNEYLVFAEVKTRRSDFFDSAETSISQKKYRRLCLAAEIFQKRFAARLNLNKYKPRLDLIFIKLGNDGVVQSLQHFESVSYDLTT